MKKTYLLNEELLRLLGKHNVRPAELARRVGTMPSAIYDLKSKRRSLGEELFVKILRRGFRYSEADIKKIFHAAIERRYFKV